MSRRFPIIVTAFALAIGTVSAVAEILPNGVDTQRMGAARPTDPAASTCGVLWFTTHLFVDEIDRLASLGLVITTTINPADLNSVNLTNYDVLVIEFAGPGILGGAQAAIEGFVAAGHGLLIQQPNAVGVLDYAPAGFGVTVLDYWWCGVGGGSGNYFATIVNGSHPITSGLVDADLSGDFDYTGTLGVGYTLLARNAVCGSPSLAAGTYMSGRVAFETGLACPCSAYPGANRYWAQLFSWLCTPSLTPALRETWGSMKVHYR